MWRIFFVHSARYFARHRTLTALNILGIALGVAVFVSVQIVNHSALESFRASVDLVAGRANLEVVGDGLLFDETVYPAVRDHPAVLAATPLVEDVCLLPDYPGEYLHLLGVDLFSNGPLRTFELTDAGDKQAEVVSFLSDPDVVAVSQSLCRRLGLKLGDPLRLATKAGVKTFRVGFLLKLSEDAPGADEHMAVMDIASVQENFQHIGRLSRIQVRLRDGADAARVIADLQPLVPANVLVQSPDRRGQQVERMISAFQLNLTALSLVSILVGMFLIYNTVAASVVRRRTEVGILRSLGMTPRQVQFLFMAEAMLLGVIGLALGLGLGIALASQLIGVVSKNISSLYILLSIRELFISPAAVAAAVLLALVSVAAAAWFPAREAANIPPVEALSAGFLHEKSVRGVNRWLVFAVVLLGAAVAVGWVSIHGGPAWLSFGSALFTLLGFAFLVPPVSRCVSVLVHPRAIVPRLAFRHFGRSLHRNSFTIAALVTALAMVIGISLMIHSFRDTVAVWLNRSVKADVFVAPAAGLIVGARETLRPEVEEIIRQTPGIAAYDSYRELRFRYEGRIVKLAAIRFPVAARFNRLVFKNGDGGEILSQAMRRDEVVVSESFARKFHAKEGDNVSLATTTGVHDFRIAGIFYDYTSEMGLILIDMAMYQKYWDDPTFNSLALYAAPGVGAAQIQDYLRPRLAPYGQYLIYSNQELRTQIFRIFDQSFAVTYVLQAVGLLVSGLGICLSLTTLVAERSREIGILRAVGASRAQVQAMVLWEAGILAVIGSALALVAGFALALILTYVINIAFFGWSIHWATPWTFLFTLPFGVIAISLLAALLPARRAALLEIAPAVKLE